MLIILLIKIKHILIRLMSEVLRFLDLINKLYCICFFTSLSLLLSVTRDQRFEVVKYTRLDTKWKLNK